MKKLTPFLLSVLVGVVPVALRAQSPEPAPELQALQVSEELAPASQTAEKSVKGFDRYKTIWIVGQRANDDGVDMIALKDSALQAYVKNLRRGFQQSGVPNFIIADPVHRAIFGIGGYVAFRAAYDMGGAVQNKDFYVADIPAVRTPDNRQGLLMDASTSRLFFRTLVETKKIGQVEAYIEANFRGDGNSFHLRQAYVSFAGFLLGQGPTNFADLGSMPNTVDNEGPHSFTYSHSLQVSYHRDFGPNKNWKAGVGLEMPIVSLSPMSAYAHLLPQRVPDIPLYVQYAWNNKQSHVRLSALLRTMHYYDDVHQQEHAQTGWGMLLTTNLKLSPVFRLFGQVAYGRGYQNYVQDLNDRGVDMVSKVGENGRLQTLPTLAWHAGVQADFASKWQINAAYAQVNTFDKGGYFDIYQAPVYRFSQYMVANLFCNITPALSVGAEGVYGSYRNVRTPLAKATRVQAQVMLTF